MTLLTFHTLTGLSWPVKKTPKFQTIKHTSVAGSSTMQSTQPYAVYAYELPFEFLRSDNVNLELQQLMSFYQRARGMAGVWHFSDPDDNAVVGQQLGLGDGTTTDFGFVRAMSVVVDPIQDATAAGLNVYDNGVLVTLGADYSILTTSQYATNYGVRFAVAPAIGHAITADFAYSFPCSFDEDSLEFSKFMALNGKGLFDSKSVKFTSVLQ